MNPAHRSQALLFSLRATGPWRLSPPSGAWDEVERLLPSDVLYSAVTTTLFVLGELDAWLDATVRSPAAVRFTSGYPWQGDMRWVVPPMSVWPLAGVAGWQLARFVPLTVVAGLLRGQAPDLTRWSVDLSSECLVASGQAGPFRPVVRSRAAVDRPSGAQAQPHQRACLEFREDAGYWFLAEFADEAARERWELPLRTALRLLGDEGIGAERYRGWGHFDVAHLRTAATHACLGLDAPAFDSNGHAPRHWLMGLYSPAPDDPIEWAEGRYALAVRTGRARTTGQRTQAVRLVAEGSVLQSATPPQGVTLDVAPPGHAHPVYRAGQPVSVLLPPEDRP